MEKVIEKLTVEGSEAFTILYITELKKALDKEVTVVEVSMKYKMSNAYAEIKIERPYFTRPILDLMLTVLTEMLKNKFVLKFSTLILGYEKNTIKVSGDIIDAVREGDEITYIVRYSVSEGMQLKVATAITDIIQFYHGTCCSVFEENKFIVDRYYFASLAEPLPVKGIYDLCKNGSYVISKFSDVLAIECVIEVTGVKGDS